MDGTDGRSPLIELRNVCFSYGGGRVVLDDADLTLGEGGRLGLVGANGSGKTTLLHLIVGLVRPSSGSVKVFGKPRTRERDFREIRTRVGLTFQDADDQLFCPTVIEDVCFGPLNQGKSRPEAIDTARETLDSLGMAGYEDRITYQLSEGEKRLVALASVLAMNPRVLLLDEPTSGLDNEAEERLACLLESLPHERIVISHDRRFLTRTTDSLCELHLGKLRRLAVASADMSASQ